MNSIFFMKAMAERTIGISPFLKKKVSCPEIGLH